MNESIVSCRGLVRLYEAKTALAGVDLELAQGKIVGLLGPNGSGKTTLIKILCGLLQPTSGTVLVDGRPVGPETKALVSYLPDRMYFADWMKAEDMLRFFADFYADFDWHKCAAMCTRLGIGPKERIRTMSKGAKEKLQLALVMCRKARLYLLDEPIAGVDPAARDFILNTIIHNYNETGTVVISTHLIGDIEQVLDEAVFLKEGRVVLHDTVDAIREREGRSVDVLFREIFRAPGWEGGGF